MASVEELLSGTLDWLGRPTSEKLSIGHILPLLLDNISFYLLDLQISGENYLLKSFEYTPTSIDHLVAISDFSVPVMIEVRDLQDTSESGWQQIMISNLTDVQSIGRDGNKAVAFYGNPVRVKWSFDPQEDWDVEARIWYEPAAAVPTQLTESPKMSTAFAAMVKLRTALSCAAFLGEAGISLTNTLMAQLNSWEAKWRQWTNTDRQQGPIQRRDFRGSRVRNNITSGWWFNRG